MAEFIINPYNISFEAIRTDLEQFVANKPEDEAWHDFYASSVGQTVIEIASALGTFYSYQFIVGRREAYIGTAQNYSSVVGLSQTLGYSAPRGTNVMCKLTILPNTTLGLGKWTVIGTYNEYDVVLMEEVALNTGEEATIQVVIGNFMYEEVQAKTSELTQFTFSNNTVTDTARLLLNGIEVPFSNELKDTTYDYYVGLSNVFGSVDVLYLQQGNYQYKTNDILRLEFIERNSLVAGDISGSNFSLHIGEFKSYEVLNNRIDKASVGMLKVKAPIYHETSMVIRARHDYSKFLLLKDPELLDANDHDIYPGLIEITYLKRDNTFMTDTEKQQWLDEIEEARPSGVAKAIIVEPQKMRKRLYITIKRLNGDVVPSDIMTQVDAILENYKNKFEVTIDLEQLEHEIEEIEGVKIARVTITENIWQPNTFYRPFDIISAPGVSKFAYYMIGTVFKSGENEPIWADNVGGQVRDNELIWEKVDEFQGLALMDWQPNHYYNIYDYVRPTDDINSLFKCVGVLCKSSATEPDWKNAIDDVMLVEDNQLVWEKMEKYSTDVPTWQMNTGYQIGDVIRPIPVTKNVDVYKVSNGEKVYAVSNVTTTYVVSNGNDVGYTKNIGLTNNFVIANTPIYSDLGTTTQTATASGSDWYYTGGSVNVGTTGWVTTYGNQGEYVASATPIYNDPDKSIVIATATENTFYYTGEHQRGEVAYTDVRGNQNDPVEANTTLYSDVNITHEIEVIDKSNYHYTGEVQSVITIDKDRSVEWNLQCIAYRAKSGTEVNWSDNIGEEVIDNNIRWLTTSAPINELTMNWNQSLDIERSITIE